MDRNRLSYQSIDRDVLRTNSISLCILSIRRLIDCVKSFVLKTHCVVAGEYLASSGGSCLLGRFHFRIYIFHDRFANKLHQTKLFGSYVLDIILLRR